MIEQAVLLAEELTIREKDLFLRSLSQNASLLQNSELVNLKANGEFSLDHVERELLNRALLETKGNVSKACTLLGISRDTLRYRMEKHNINSASFTNRTS
jgi:DNA-binding NtrC family response regulator